MGVRILDDWEVGACLYCSTSMTAFGPIFESAECAEDFLKWLGELDPRSMTDGALQTSYAEWRAERCDEDGDLKTEPEPEDES